MLHTEPLHITVPRTARYYLLGSPNSAVRDIWVVCHGYGQLAAAFAKPFFPLVDATRLIVVPEALSRFYLDVNPPHTPESAVGALWMTREDREAEIGDIVSYLDTLIDRICELLGAHGVAREQLRVHALGFSQGAPMVCRWAARGATLIEHLILWGSGVPTDVNVRSIRERVEGFRVDLVYGRDDQYVTAEAVATQEAMFVEAKVGYQVHAFPGGHSLNSEVLRALMAL